MNQQIGIFAWIKNTLKKALIKLYSELQIGTGGQELPLKHSTLRVIHISVERVHLKSSHGSLQLQRPFKGHPFESKRKLFSGHVSSFSHIVSQFCGAKF